ncbi:hypothetical protein ACOSQ2_003364 [Xanthoceras sorbifolium]
MSETLSRSAMLPSHPNLPLLGRGLPLYEDHPTLNDKLCQSSPSTRLGEETGSSQALTPPVLMSPIKGRPLIQYITGLEGSLSALLAQNNENGNENSLSRTLVVAEHNYSPTENACLNSPLLALILLH